MEEDRDLTRRIEDERNMRLEKECNRRRTENARDLTRMEDERNMTGAEFSFPQMK